jgi:hypothetical protein
MLAAIVAVSPGAANTSESGKSVIEAAACWIEVAAAADADPAVAVMEVVPLLTAVIRPSADTLAMVSSAEIHMKLATDIFSPLASFA